LTNQGRVYAGYLKSFDQRMNLILSTCEEHIYTNDLVPMEK